MRAFAARQLWPAVVLLLLLQAVLALAIVHRESLTFDEDDHSFAGYMMWKTADYGLNPEHPPLVKLLATLPVLGEPLWVPPLQGRNFKAEAYLSGRDWLAHNDGGSQRLLFRMRASTELLALALAFTVFLAARAWFGDLAGLLALALVVFDPNVLAHSALVTTDIGVSLFFLASVLAFHHYVRRPSWPRLLGAGVVCGLLLATKHSGILLAPMLVLLMAYEVSAAPRGERRRQARRMGVALLTLTAVSVVVLWAFYGFRFAARPAGLALSTSLAEYAAPLQPMQKAVVMGVARLHLLPESYLMGLVDVKRMAEFYPTYLFGRVHPHGVPYYFPVVILIKSTLGLLGLLVLAVVAAVSGLAQRRRELVYVLVPPVVYLLVAMTSGMNIGARHLLPMYTFLFVFAAGGAVAMANRTRAWAVAVAVLAAAHVLSSALVYPREMSYANEAWGGPSRTHWLLSDANVDWAQQLYQVKAWQDRHPGEECWFAYFAYPEVQPSTYGIHCHAMPTVDTLWLEGAELIPPRVHGTMLISAGDLSGCEWPTSEVNPYRSFAGKRPDEVIENAVFVYRGDFDLREAAAHARLQRSGVLLKQGDTAGALALAREAATLAPENVYAQTALGDAAAAAGDKGLARSSWLQAEEAAKRLEEGAQPGYLVDLQSKLAKL